MRGLLLILLVLVTSISYGQTFEKKGRFVSSPLYDTIVTVFIGSDTTGGGGIGLISDGDTSYIYATSDCLTILADTIRLDGFLAFPASVSLDSLNTNYINYPTTPRQPTSAGVTNTGTIYRDTSNVVAVDRCLPWTCNDDGDVILTDSSDNVGIGTSTPTLNLDLIGDFQLNSSSFFISTESPYGSFNNGLRWYIDSDTIVMGSVNVGLGNAFNLNAYQGSTSSSISVNSVGDIRFVPDGLGNSFGFTAGVSKWIMSGDFAYQDGSEADGYVLTSDVDGDATWQDPNCIFGYESIQGDAATVGSPFVVSMGDTLTIPNNNAGGGNSQLPCGVDSFYSVADTTLLGYNEGDKFTIRINFKGESTSNTGSATLLLDIDGAQDIILSRVITFPKGTGNENSFDIFTTYFTGSTFLANGGKLRIVSEEGDNSFWDIGYVIEKTYHGK